LFTSQPNYIQVKIKQCVHYSAFRYGHNEYHPYESYIIRLNKGETLQDIRFEFLQFLKAYRPRDMGEALGIRLSKRYPMWIYPWNPLRFKGISFLIYSFNLWLKLKNISGWHANAKEIIDIITHFSEEGIPKANIEKEYGWLHGAYDSIKKNSYLPEKYGFPYGRLLINEDGRIACLVYDGNHRVSTLSALGYDSLLVEYSESENVYLRELQQWPLVKNGYYREYDARLLFEAYFNGNHNYKVGVLNERFV
jgi:hypothetical protein